MRQITIPIFDLLLIVFAVIGFLFVITEIGRIGSTEPVSIININVSLSEARRKELTAQDHMKGLLKIGWDKLICGIAVQFLWKWLSKVVARR
jgi:hypothetical protein